MTDELARLREEVGALREALGRKEAAEALPDAFPALACRVHASWLAVPLAQVAEVAPRLLVSPLPDAPAHVAGYVRFRGAHVPVLELGLRLGGEALPVRVEDRIVLVRRVEGELCGLLVEEAEGVVRVERHALSPVQPDAPGAAWALGYVQGDERSPLLVSLDELLRPLAGLRPPAEDAA